MRAQYVELHAHSCWSLREGASNPGELVGRAMALGYSAMAVTDHDNLYGAMEYAQAARERGLRPITGAELTLADESHLTVLAATVEGYRNLCRLLTRAYNVHGKDTPFIDEAWLFELSEGLIVLSGCSNGRLSRLLDAGEREEAERVATLYRDEFGREHFFVELQHHDVFGDTQRVDALAAIAGRVGLDIVATNNVHYHVRARHRLNDVLVAIHHRLTLDTSHRERRPNSEFFLRSAEAMASKFSKHPEAITNTVAIAERCTFDLTKDIPYRLPDYPDLPEGVTMDEFLRAICERAFQRRYGTQDAKTHADALNRLERELGLIAKHELAGFFLVYWDILQLVGEIAHELRGRDPKLAPDQRPVGRGRGSSVSSIVCYLIGLSHIDPVKNELYLERFLNEELHSLPDIDLDFPRDIRDELLKRIYVRYGKEHAAIVAAFPTYRFRNAIQDLGKALGLPQAALAKLSKMGGLFTDATEVEGEMELIPELAPLAKAPIWRDLIDLSQQVAGFPRHISQHVGGVVISADALSSVVPIEPARMEGRFVCQWDKDSVDDARFVKIDFLALGMLSAVDECLDMIEEVEGKKVDLGRIPHDSPEIYASIHEGDTMGVFQIESRAQIQTLPFTQPANIDDLAVQVAIIRPGPIMAGTFRPYMEYRRKASRGEHVDIDYGHPELDPLLKHCLRESLGHVLYQDQVLQISQAIAGFTAGQADKLRRAMSRKRSTEAMEALAGEFYVGAEARGVSRAAAEVAYKKMAAFAAFGFPKSHAVAFALLAYESCWLRYHHPLPYYAALFNAQPMGFYSVEVLTGDATRHGIETLMPDINLSRMGAWPEGDNLRLGLNKVNGMGGTWQFKRAKRESVSERIVVEREASGPYQSLYELVTRARLTHEQATALIRAGVLDSFGLPRRELLWQLGLLIKQTNDQPALPMPVAPDMAELPSLKPWHQLGWDFELTGVTGGPHPMALVRPLLHEGIITTQHLGGVHSSNRLPHGMEVEIAGMVVTRQRPQTASGVMFMLLEDEFGLGNIVVYKKLQEAQREIIRSAPFVIIRGRIDNEQSGFPNVIADEFIACPIPGNLEVPNSHDWG